MAKKKDPFEDFAAKMLSGPKVSDSVVPAEASSELPSPTPESSEPAREPEVNAPVHHTAPAETERKGLRADHKPFTVYIKTDLLQKIRTANYKNNLTAKAIINQALEEYFEKHKGLL